MATTLPEIKQAFGAILDDSSCYLRSVNATMMGNLGAQGMAGGDLVGMVDTDSKSFTSHLSKKEADVLQVRL